MNTIIKFAEGYKENSMASQPTTSALDKLQKNEYVAGVDQILKDLNSRYADHPELSDDQISILISSSDESISQKREQFKKIISSEEKSEPDENHVKMRSNLSGQIDCLCDLVKHLEGEGNRQAAKNTRKSSIYQSQKRP